MMPIPVAVAAFVLALPPAAAALQLPADCTAPSLAAVERLESRVEAAPEDARAHLELSCAYAARGEDARAELHLRRALWRAVAAMEAAEMHAFGAMEGARAPEDFEAAAPAIEARDLSAETLLEILDRVVFETPWGGEALDELRAIYPASTIFQRYAAALAAREGRERDALALYRELLVRQPADAGLQRSMATLLEEMDRPEEALDAWTRALELEPEDEAAFRALLRLHRSLDSSEEFLEQLRRLVHRRPDSRTVAEREIELLQRLGRLDEAVEAARRLQERLP